MKLDLKSLKEIDYKDFLLHHGQWVALGVGGLFLLPLLISGVSAALSSGSPTATASEIKQKADGVETQIAQGPASPNLPTTPPENLMQPVRNDPVEWVKWRAFYPLFINTTWEDTKRRNPEILSIVSAHWDYIQAPVPTNEIREDKDGVKIWVLVPKEKADVRAAPLDEKKSARIKQIKAILEAASKNRRSGGGGMGGGMMGGGGMGQGGMGGSIQRNVQAEGEQYEMKLVPLDKLDKIDKARPAEVMLPVRMVQITASFPWKQQLESYRKALRKTSLADLFKDKEDLPHFIGLRVQRRPVGLDGKPFKDQDWADLDVVSEEGKTHRWAQYGMLMRRAVEREPDDAKIADTVIKPISEKHTVVLPRPKLARDLKYPDLKLPEIEETVKSFEKSEKTPTKAKNPLEERIKSDFDEPESDDAAKKKQAGSELETAPADQGSKEKEKDPVVAEYGLVRFFDVTVQPGFTYEYRVQIRAANPNYGEKKKDLVAYPTLSSMQELPAQWSYDQGDPDSKRIIASIPPETFFYAMDKDNVDRLARSRYPADKDTAYVQVQSWQQSLKLKDVGDAIPIGEWSMADIGVRRGEYIGHTEKVELPMWVPTKENYDFAKVKLYRNRPPQPAPVDFSTNAVLVDFEGGKGASVKVGGKTVTDDTDTGVEMLVYIPDPTGNYRLVVRSSQNDVKDTQRKQRHDDWKNWIESVKENIRTGGKGTSKDDPFKTKPKPK